MVYDPLTKLQCCPTSDGGAAAVLASERFVKEHGLEAQAVEIVGQAMTTDFESTFWRLRYEPRWFRHDQGCRQGRVRGVGARSRRRRRY